jgi:hypothetical protein
LPASGVAQSEELYEGKNDLTRMQLAGQVKSIVAVTYVITGHTGQGELKWTPKMRETNDFDHEGYRTETNSFDLWHGVWNKTLYNYDKPGCLSKVRCLYKNEIAIDETDYGYDAQGRLASVSVRGNFNEFDKKTLIYTYVSYGDTLETITTDKNGQIKSRSIASKGAVLQTTCYNDVKQDSVYAKITFFYSENGKLKEGRYYGFDGGLVRRDICLYNDSGRITEGQSFVSEGGKRTTPALIRYAYDEQNNLIFEAEYDSLNRLMITRSSKYQYDRLGNWTEQLLLINEKPTEKCQRSISYY